MGREQFVLFTCDICRDSKVQSFNTDLPDGWWHCPCCDKYQCGQCNDGDETIGCNQPDCLADMCVTCGEFTVAPNACSECAEYICDDCSVKNEETGDTLCTDCVSN